MKLWNARPGPGDDQSRATRLADGCKATCRALGLSDRDLVIDIQRDHRVRPLMSVTAGHPLVSVNLATYDISSTPFEFSIVPTECELPCERTAAAYVKPGDRNR